MQKKAVALLVAGLVSVPMAAQAGVEVYGQARLSVGLISDDNPDTGAEDSKVSVTSHSSRLGFKGVEELGDGLKALYQVEGEIDMDDNDKGLISSTRNTFVGLSGGFGTVLLGHHDTPYKIATGDIMGDSYGDYNSVISSTHDYRADNVIAYISPDFSGFTFAAAYVPDVQDIDLSYKGTLDPAETPPGDNLKDGTADDDNAATSLMGKYVTGPFSVSLALQSISNVKAVSGPDADAMKLGLGYDMGATKFSLIYENEEMSDNSQDQDNVYFSVSHAMDANTYKLAVGQKGEKKSGADNGGTFVALSAYRAMGKNTELYAVYAQMANDANGTNGLNGAGFKSGFDDKTTSALAVGINLKFSSM